MSIADHAGRDHEEHGEQQPGHAYGAGAPPGLTGAPPELEARPVGEVDQGEGQQDQPEGARTQPKNPCTPEVSAPQE